MPDAAPIPTTTRLRARPSNPLRLIPDLLGAIMVVLGVAPFSAAQDLGLTLTPTQSTLWNPYATYLYDEPCSHYLRNPPQAYANLSYGVGGFVAGTPVTYYPDSGQCRRLNGTDNLTYAYVAANVSLGVVAPK